MLWQLVYLVLLTKTKTKTRIIKTKGKQIIKISNQVGISSSSLPLATLTTSIDIIFRDVDCSAPVSKAFFASAAVISLAVGRNVITISAITLPERISLTSTFNKSLPNAVSAAF